MIPILHVVGCVFSVLFFFFPYRNLSDKRSYVGLFASVNAFVANSAASCARFLLGLRFARFLKEMAKGTRERRRIASRSPYSLPSKIHSDDEMLQKERSKIGHKKDWEDATCSVCMEYPHHAVLLLCSSHDKGCRPYMCGTSLRHSNCLDQYRKAYTKITLPCHDHPHLYGSVDMGNAGGGRFSSWLADKSEVTELACPLCRGQVKGWTVVDSAREYLNRKTRSCMQDGCSFVGNYKELRKHVKAEHPCAKPREVDPLLEQKWRMLEGEREREDVISTITASMPSALVIGDYVIEGGGGGGGRRYGFASEEDEDGFDDEDLEQQEGNAFDIGINTNLMNVFLFLQSIGTGRHDRGTNLTAEEESTVEFNYSDQDSEDYGENNNDSPSLVNRLRRQSPLFLGRSGRRRRRRDANRGNR